MRISYKDFVSLFPDASVVQGTLDGDLFFSVDSRTCKDDEIFIPIKGLHVDGHAFLKDALEKCKGAFIAYEYKYLYETVIKDYFPDKLIILVSHPENVLMELARWWRNTFTIPFIGITGSVGKTSTKLILQSILQHAHKKFFVSAGNQNTVIGIALNFARMSHEHEYAVFELGISKKHEMKKLVEFVRPSIALITSIGHSHLQGLGTLQDVAVEKKKIFSLFTSTNIGIVNGDCNLLINHSYAHPVVKFGKKKHNQIQARSIKIDEGKLSFILKIYQNKYNVSFDTTHESYVHLVLGATALACQMGIDEKIIVEAIQKPLYRYRRFEKKPLKFPNSFLIDDAYNASPESTRAALFAFDLIPWQGKKVVILGDMKELGEKSLTYHRKVGRLFFKLLSVDKLILVGNQVHCMSKILPKSLSVTNCATLEEAKQVVDSLLRENMLILFKASQGMNFIELVNYYSVPYKAVTL